ncbi:peptidoglycan/LPS O-acetylase OafA/YrhL [Rhodococcus sp. PvP016]|uniref:Peptidoglycan/LPS O-acetylase OafA/YrhL n=1 Tax=Rhodococcoides corynebacterioides TaxID=53972 RepID=A0ABS2KWV6_9NOCA|nr:peptidoglycan/LPS O-acetylase OafA/YrhL [Rhodococcus corynebacterioides]MBP1114683.1 peptidoglycan/LPS O-acetylase OafA/YrhL [Rhodococcus sp. PvP016]
MTTAEKARVDPRIGGFVPALEGMRGLAAVGVLLTHVAFQTGSTGTPVVGPLLGRLDLAVAVFFALSGFLLWRPHAAAARGSRPRPSVRTYLVHRAARILPAYWLVVVVVLALLPGAGGGVRVWIANLTLVQVFVPLTLTQGMTQMWSLSVEVAFYLLLPFIGVAMAGLRGPRARLRTPVLVGVSALSLGWTFLPISTADGVNIENWLPGYLAWFAAGMVVAEAAADLALRESRSDSDLPAVPLVVRIASRRRLLTGIAAVAFAASSTPIAGAQDLTTPSAWQFAVKVALGAVVAFCLVAPLAVGTGVRTRWLSGPFALVIGRWSYGIFIWHLAVLAVVFPVLGVSPFGGQFLLVAGATVVLTLPVAAASYALVEEPVRVALRRREARRADRIRANEGSAASATAPTDASAAS